MLLARQLAAWTRSATLLGLAGVHIDGSDEYSSSSSSSSLEPRASAAPYATFVFPADGTETFYYRDQVEVTYTSSAESSYMVVNCNQGVGNVEQNQEAPGGNATVGVTLQLANGSSYSQSSDLSCWFQLRNVSGYAHDAVGSNSKSWNYIHTERSGGPATLAISTSSSTASSSTATGTLTTSTSSSATATTTAASASSDKSNVSAAPDGAAQTSATSSASSANTTATASTSSKGISGTVGVAIGVSIGALAVIIPLGIWAFVHRRRRQRQLAGGRRHRLEFDGGDDGVSPGTGRRHYPSVNPNVVEAAGPGLGNDNSEMYSYYAYKEHAPLTSPTATTARSPVSTVLYPGSAVGEGKAAEMAHPSNEVYELYGTNETRQV